MEEEEEEEGERRREGGAGGGVADVNPSSSSLPSVLLLRICTCPDGIWW